jgi:hypothetical protein
MASRSGLAGMASPADGVKPAGPAPTRSRIFNYQSFGCFLAYTGDAGEGGNIVLTDAGGKGIGFHAGENSECHLRANAINLEQGTAHIALFAAGKAVEQMGILAHHLMDI